MARVTVTDYQKWGDLIKRWATNQKPRPTTPLELKDQMAQEGLGAFDVDDKIKALRVIQDDDQTLTILLPRAAAINEGERSLDPQKDYPLPPFYKEAWRGVLPQIDDMQKFNTQRIGEYTIQECQ
jgi:hypothetical protein